MRKTVIIGVLILAVMFTLYAVFGKGTAAQEIRNGVKSSLEEDFKIKESLGQLFFAEKENEASAVSAETRVTSLCMPASGEAECVLEMGEKCLKIKCNKLSKVVAVCEGTVEVCEDGRITLRHSDGKLSVYSGVNPLVKASQKVLQGDTVGYIYDELTYKLLANCVSLDPLEYIR